MKSNQKICEVVLVMIHHSNFVSVSHTVSVPSSCTSLSVLLHLSLKSWSIDTHKEVPGSRIHLQYSVASIKQYKLSGSLV